MRRGVKAFQARRNAAGSPERHRRCARRGRRSDDGYGRQRGRSQALIRTPSVPFCAKDRDESPGLSCFRSGVYPPVDGSRKPMLSRREFYLALRWSPAWAPAPVSSGNGARGSALALARSDSEAQILRFAPLQLRIDCAQGDAGPWSTSSRLRKVQMRPFPSPFGRSDPFFDRFFREFFPQHPNGARAAEPRLSFILDGEGFIITNHHVVTMPTRIRVSSPTPGSSRRSSSGATRGPTSRSSRVEGDDLPAATLGDSDQLGVGDLGCSRSEIHSDSSIRSRRNRQREGARHRRRAFDDFIQTDASINPGNIGAGR